METEPSSGLVSPVRPTWGRRFGDLLAMAAVAVILVVIAGTLVWKRGPVEPLAPPPSREESQPHWVDVPALGMEVTREEVPGDQAAAITVLDRLCDAALQTPGDWVLGLDQSPVEQELLSGTLRSSPLPNFGKRDSRVTRVHPLEHPVGRVGVSHPVGVGNSAAATRVICWGVVLTRKDGGYTVWFVRPRDRIARSSAQGPP